MGEDNRKLCILCGDFLPPEDFIIADDVCGFCDVVLRDDMPSKQQK